MMETVFRNQDISKLTTSVTSKMDMSTTSEHACKISMLWNWYTVDTCFIAKSWHVRSKGVFAGSCVGVFLLVMASQWLHRFCRELDNALAKKHEANQKVLIKGSNSSSEDDQDVVGFNADSLQVRNPYVYALSHSWLFNKQPGSIVPNFAEQVLRSLLYTLEWGVSYMIMLLFMYYNGYIIISCVLGAFFGKLAFTINEPLTCDDGEDRKCCK